MTTGLTLINWLGRGNDIAKLVRDLEDENKRLKIEMESLKSQRNPIIEETRTLYTVGQFSEDDRGVKINMAAMDPGATFCCWVHADDYVAIKAELNEANAKLERFVRADMVEGEE